MINLSSVQPGQALNPSQERTNTGTTPSVGITRSQSSTTLETNVPTIPAVLISVGPSTSVNTDAVEPISGSDISSNRVQSLERPPDTLGTSSLSKQELAVVQELAARDREVRAHELAHKSALGSLGGAMTFTFQRGPDGRLYAIGGEVSIQKTSGPKTPEEAVREAEIILRAATAPANPSDQDLRVAAQAALDLSQARSALISEQIAEARGESTDESGRVGAVTGAEESTELVNPFDPDGDSESTNVLGQEEESELVNPFETGSDEEESEEERVDFFEQAQARKEAAGESLAEYQQDLADIQKQLAEVNQKLVELGVLESLFYEPGNLVNEET